MVHKVLYPSFLFIYTNSINNGLNIEMVDLPVQCNTNIFDYSNIRILGGEYLVFEYEYLFSSVQIYLIFIFGQIDLTNIYSVHFGIVLLDIRHIFGIYSNIRHRISIIRIRISYFIGTNIFGIRIWSKSKLLIYSYSYSVQNLIFVLPCPSRCY